MGKRDGMLQLKKFTILIMGLWLGTGIRVPDPGFELQAAIPSVLADLYQVTGSLGDVKIGASTTVKGSSLD